MVYFIGLFAIEIIYPRASIARDLVRASLEISELVFHIEKYDIKKEVPSRVVFLICEFLSIRIYNVWN